MQTQLPIDIDQDQIATFCKKNYITKLSFFGSVLREDFTDKSDIDVLVEFDPDHMPGLIGFAGMEIELSEQFGRKVDMLTPRELSKYFREDVLAMAVAQYVAE